MKYFRNYQNATQGHEVSKRCWKNGTGRFARCRVATNLPFVKNATSAKRNKTRSACTDVTGLVRAEPDDICTALSTVPGT